MDLDKRIGRDDNDGMFSTDVSLAGFLQHPVFLAAALSWFSSQLVKVILSLFDQKKKGLASLSLTVFWNTGGMPSSHSAVVCALCVSIGFLEGPGSSVFILSLFLALIVLRDALGVRQAAGTQARALNLVIKELNQKFGLQHAAVKEIKGHSLPEVGVGMVLGICVGLLLSLL